MSGSIVNLHINFVFIEVLCAYEGGTLLNERKRKFEENECSVWRWVVTAIVGYAFGFVISNVMAFALVFLGLISNELIRALVVFSGLYVGLVIAIKLIAKTSIKNFVLGVNKKFSLKKSLNILGLYFLGEMFMLLFSVLFDFKSIRYSGVSLGQYLISFVLCLAFLWMQTTWEELMFRGIVIRAVCKNEIKFSKKSVIAGIVSSLIFMALHFFNPEFTSQKTVLMMLFSALMYFYFGFFAYILDLYEGSILPGILVHWVNNFYYFTIFRDEVSVLKTATIFVKYGETTGIVHFAREIIVWLPLIVFYVVRFLKNKKLVNCADKKS